MIFFLLTKWERDHGWGKLQSIVHKYLNIYHYVLARYFAVSEAIRNPFCAIVCIVMDKMQSAENVSL